MGNPTTKSFNEMTMLERANFLTTGKLTIGTIHQFIDGKFVTFYVARCRGFILSMNDSWKFDSPKEARAYGEQCLDTWKQLINQ